jgi:hypothetical protein
MSILPRAAYADLPLSKYVRFTSIPAPYSFFLCQLPHDGPTSSAMLGIYLSNDLVDTCNQHAFPIPLLHAHSPTDSTGVKMCRNRLPLCLVRPTHHTSRLMLASLPKFAHCSTKSIANSADEAPIQYSYHIQSSPPLNLCSHLVHTVSSSCLYMISLSHSLAHWAHPTTHLQLRRQPYSSIVSSSLSSRSSPASHLNTPVSFVSPPSSLCKIEQLRQSLPALPRSNKPRDPQRDKRAIRLVG